MSLSTATAHTTIPASLNSSSQIRSKVSGPCLLALQSDPNTWRASEIHINSKNCCGHIESFVVPVHDGTVEIRRTTLTPANRVIPQLPTVECCAETRRNGQVEITNVSEASYKVVEQKYYSFLTEKIENVLAGIAENPSQVRWQADPINGFKTVLAGENIELSVKSNQLSPRSRPTKQDFRVTARSTLCGGVSRGFSGELAQEVFEAARQSLS